MDVLVASEWLVPAVGGAERVALERAQALVERGHRVRLVCVEAPRAEDAAPVPAGVEVLTVPAPSASGAYWAGKRALRDAVGAGVRAAIDRRRPDVVVGSLHAAPAAIDAATEHDIPAVLSMPSYEALCRNAFHPAHRCEPWRDCVRCPAAQGLDRAEREELRAARGAHERALARAAAIVADSRTVAAALRGWSGREATVVAPVSAPLAPAGASFDGPVVLAAARWAPHKGSELLGGLCRAARALGREVRVTRRGLERRPPGAEVVDNAPAAHLLRSASALLVPSQWEEPFGRLAWEAQSAGVPVLAADAGGLAEVVPPQRLVAPRADPGAWSRALAALLVDEREWSRACAEGERAAAAMLEPDPLEAFTAVLTAAVTRPAAALPATPG